jgi:branched-chain amino acid transport system substrate-binding protein
MKRFYTIPICRFPYSRSLFLVSCILLSCVLLSCTKKDSDTSSLTNTIKLGAILDLTGDYSQAGLTGKAAIELALANLNQRYASVGSALRFSCTYADTHMDTVLALSAAKAMYADGIRLLVAGPNNSAELKSIRAFLDANQMLSLSSFSSSPSLATPNDYIFRLITDDNVQGQALVRMMKFDSVKAIIPIWREDTYGSGLYQTVKQKFEAMGGTVLPGISYKPNALNYQEMIASVANQANTAIVTYGASKVAVLLISYQEASDFLHFAAAQNNLAQVKWYGCDANAQRASVTTDAVAAAFALDVRFLAPIMGIGTAGKIPSTADVLAGQILTKTGLQADAYALTSYDAVQIYGLAYDLVQSYNAPLIKTILPGVCESYNYLGISRKLNPAGDLAAANYIFWTVTSISGDFSWDSYATWMAEGDYIWLK